MLSLSLLILSCLPQVLAFPHLAASVFQQIEVERRQTSGNQNGVPLKCTPVQPPFDPAQQYVSNKGQYAFVAPGPTDARGPCPGLNAAANHGYLPHNGVATIQQFVTGTYNTFGMAADLAGFLGVYGAIFDGNLAAYSIGGPTLNLPVVSGLLGTPTGLSGSHNKYENDASPMRGDLYLYGNDYLTQVSNFQQFYNMQAGIPDNQANFGLDNITAFRYLRFHDSINRNPYFFNGPFSGALASPAAYTFIYRFMANKSATYPEGRLDRNTLKSFYSITGNSGNFKYTPGYEAIPDNWYKRHPSDSYSIPYFACDVVNMVSKHPEFFSIGGNTGKVNTFTGIDPGNLTGGVYQASTLTQGDNAYCYFTQLIVQAAPDLLEGLYTDVTPAMNLLSSEMANITKGHNCPIAKLQYSQFQKFPGYSKSYNGYSGL